MAKQKANYEEAFYSFGRIFNPVDEQVRQGLCGSPQASRRTAVIMAVMEIKPTPPCHQQTHNLETNLVKLYPSQGGSKQWVQDPNSEEMLEKKDEPQQSGPSVSSSAAAEVA